MINTSFEGLRRCELSALFKLSDLYETNPSLASSFLWTYDDWQGVDGDDLYLHLGCGDTLLDGFVNLDFIPHVAGVEECHLLHVWPDKLFDRIQGFYAEDLIEHFFLMEQLYILCSMNCLLAEQGLVRLLMPDMDQLWSYGRRFDLEALLQASDYFVTTMRCRNGMEAVNMGMRMGGHRWLHDFTSFQRVAEACGFSAARTTCGVSSDPKMTGINIRDESGISFAVELRRKRRMARILVPPERVVNAALIEDLGDGQCLYQATNEDPGIAYRFPTLDVRHLALINVRSANLSEFREHNFSKAYFLPSEKGAIYVDRSLHSAPYMNAFNQVDVTTALGDTLQLDQLRFDPSERTGDYFTVGPLELFVFDHSEAHPPASVRARPREYSFLTTANRVRRGDETMAHHRQSTTPLPAELEAHIVRAECRYGAMSFFDFDGPIGLSLALYGEWAQNEIEVLRPYVPIGGHVLDVGANLGTHTLAFASFVTKSGRVVAIEPQMEVYTLLRRNVAHNGLDGIVRPMWAGAADRPGRALVPCIGTPDGQNLGATKLFSEDPDRPPTPDQMVVEVLTVDALELDRLDFLKIDVEGAEADVLRGASRTIEKFRPVVSIEGGTFTNAWPAVRLMASWGYTAFFMRPSAFNANNYSGSSKNVFGPAEEGLLLFLPRERLEQGTVPPPKRSAAPILTSLDLARALLSMVAYRLPSPEADTSPQSNLSDLLEETLLALKSKRGDELCVAANNAAKRLHNRAKSLRRVLTSISSSTDGPQTAGAMIEAALAETAPALPLIDEPATLEPWPAAPAMQDWAHLAQQMKTVKDLSVGSESNALTDVIVPVFRGRDQTLACLYSVLTSTNKRPFHLVVIDDASPEPELSAELQGLADLGLFTLVSHTERRGFVASANEGMRLHTGRDVLLLNSDTIVFSDWLDRMQAYAMAHPDVATVTPLSNNATICSYPVVERDNRAALEISSAELDALAARVNSGVGITIPTAVGFCMYIRRSCLDAVGLFDEEAFGYGYGEENDFCMRANAAGWRNVFLPGVFVRHAGCVSFGQEALDHMDSGLDTVKRLHPTYEDTVSAYCSADKSRRVRRALDLSRLERASADYRGTMLMVTHSWGGGVERHVKDLCTRLAKENVRVLLLRPYSKQSLCLWGLNLPQALHFSNLAFDLSRHFADLLVVLASLNIQHIHAHNFAGLHQTAPDLTKLLAAILNVSYDFTIHDYIAWCPNIHLVDQWGRPCDGGPQWQCRNCVDGELPPLLRCTDIRRWHQRYENFLCSARCIFAPSKDTHSRLADFFPRCADRIIVRPHPEDDAAFTANSLKTGTRNPERTVAVIGAIGPHKGAELLLACARDARSRRLPLTFRVIGYTCLDDALRQEGVTITGVYSDGELGELLTASNSTIAFFPALWPETYSYTLSEAARSGLFPVCFDLGAPAERIRDWKWGKLLPSNLRGDAAAVNDALLAISPTPRPSHLDGQLFSSNQYGKSMLRNYYGFGEDHPLHWGAA